MSLAAAGCTPIRGPSLVRAVATAGPLLYVGGYTFDDDDSRDGGGAARDGRRP